MWISYFYDYAISRFNVGQLYVRINSSKTSKTCNNDFGGRNVCEYRCQYRCTDQHADERGCWESDHGRIHYFSFLLFLGYEHVIANFPAFTLATLLLIGQMDGMTAKLMLLHNLFFALDRELYWWRF